MKIRALGTKLLHAGGPMDMVKLIVPICNFLNGHKNVIKSQTYYINLRTVAEI
jgi:hypothetical protein